MNHKGWSSKWISGSWLSFNLSVTNKKYKVGAGLSLVSHNTSKSLLFSHLQDNKLWNSFQELFEKKIKIKASFSRKHDILQKIPLK